MSIFEIWFLEKQKSVIYVVKQNMTVSSSNVNHNVFRAMLTPLTHKFRTVTPKSQKNLPREAIAQNNDFPPSFKMTTN